MQKNKYLILLTVLCLFCIYVVNYFGNNQNKINVSHHSNNQMKYNNSLALMYETAADSGEYIQSNDSTWPTGDYVYNEALSKCENGSKISYNETTKKVIVEANTSDKCYVYFDIKPKVLFANYIKELYSSNGVNNLYLHDGSLANSAGDNSLRYAGSSETTKNFVCFGSDAITCENDSLYRIIGVFDDKVKLIKYDYANSNILGTDGDYSTNTYTKSRVTTYKGSHETINTYTYNYKGNPTLNSGSGSNDWETSLLNKTNLNTNYLSYLNNLDLKWENMIVDNIWGIRVYSTVDAVAKDFNRVEKLTYTSISTKIGLMYPSDYGYAIIPNYWNTNLSAYSNPIINDNWMYMGLQEWTITPNSGNNGKTNAYIIGNLGPLSTAVSLYSMAVRPVFYLNSNVQYLSGDGTSTNPYRIAQ